MKREYQINIERTERAGNIAIVSGLPGDGAEMNSAELHDLARHLSFYAYRLDKLNAASEAAK